MRQRCGGRRRWALLRLLRPSAATSPEGAQTAPPSTSMPLDHHALVQALTQPSVTHVLANPRRQIMSAPFKLEGSKGHCQPGCQTRQHWWLTAATHCTQRWWWWCRWSLLCLHGSTDRITLTWPPSQASSSKQASALGSLPRCVWSAPPCPAVTHRLTASARPAGGRAGRTAVQPGLAARGAAQRSSARACRTPGMTAQPRLLHHFLQAQPVTKRRV